MDLDVHVLSSSHKTFFSPAEKTSERGRAKGGLAVFVNSHIFGSYLLKATKNYIITRISKDDFNVIVCNVYISPSHDIKSVLNDLKVAINFIVLEFVNDPLIVVGDFNCRVGSRNNIVEDALVNDTELRCEMLSVDLELNGRGKYLLECMEDLGLFLINVRTCSDSQAQFTFASSVGCSVIDLAWGNQKILGLIKDLKVMNCTITRSDHFPVKLVLDKELMFSSCKGGLRWKEQLSSVYFEAMYFSPRVSMIFNNVDKCNEVLDSTIINTANEIGMIESNNFLNLRRKNEWFNSE